jgi:hypothetical protein
LELSQVPYELEDHVIQEKIEQKYGFVSEHTDILRGYHEGFPDIQNGKDQIKAKLLTYLLTWSPDGDQPRDHARCSYHSSVLSARLC